MDEEERFNQYVEYNLEGLRELFLEAKDDEFMEWCYERYISYDPSDDAYDRYKDDLVEQEVLK